MEKLIKQGKLEKQLKPPPKPNANILVALNKLLTSTFKVLYIYIYVYLFTYFCISKNLKKYAILVHQLLCGLIAASCTHWYEIPCGS